MVYYPVNLSGPTTSELRKESTARVDPAEGEVTAHMEEHRKSVKLKAPGKRPCGANNNLNDSSNDPTTGRASDKTFRNAPGGKEIRKKAPQINSGSWT